MAILAQAVVFSSLFLLSILGCVSPPFRPSEERTSIYHRFIAALQSARGAVYIYNKFIFIHTPVILLSFGLTLLATLQPDNSDPDGPTKCVNGSSSPIIAQFCSHSMTPIRILPIAFLGAASLIQFSASGVVCAVFLLIRLLGRCVDRVYQLCRETRRRCRRTRVFSGEILWLRFGPRGKHAVHVSVSRAAVRPGSEVN